jgi:hypothetical protein
MSVEPPPRRWDVCRDGLPPSPIRVFLDGVGQRYVTAYDVGEGWVDGLCIDPECPANKSDDGRTHADAVDYMACRRPRAWGLVEVTWLERQP